MHEYLKGLHHRCFLHKKLRQAKIKTSQEKIFFSNADADVEMPMSRFPNGRSIIYCYLSLLIKPKNLKVLYESVLLSKTWLCVI